MRVRSEELKSEAAKQPKAFPKGEGFYWLVHD